MSIIEERLRTLRDVDAVYGSVMFSAAGAVIARDLPATFDTTVLQSVGSRLALLFEAFQVEGEELDACVLRFGEHGLHLRRVSWGVLGVLAAAGTNLPALQMAMSLVLRRLDSQGPTRSALPPGGRAAFAPDPRLTGQRPSEPPLGEPPLPRQFPAAIGGNAVGPDSAPASDRTRPVRMYRGRRVSDE